MKAFALAMVLVGCSTSTPPPTEPDASTASSAQAERKAGASEPIAAAGPSGPVPTKKSGARAAPKARSSAHPSKIKAFHIGHSLMSDIPDMLRAFAKDHSDVEYTFKEQFVPGGALHWQLKVIREWDDDDWDPTYRAFVNKVYGPENFDTLVLVEGVPRGMHEIQETQEKALVFVNMALKSNPKSQTYFYEPWNCKHTGTPKGCEYDEGHNKTLKWLPRIDADKEMWRSVVHYINKKIPASAPRMRIIPGGPALAAVVKAAQAGEVPGFKKLDDFFEDDIHLNMYGRYVIACAHFATMYGRSPVGLPHELEGRWGARLFGDETWNGHTYPPMKKAAARRMQQIVWDVVRAEPMSGIN